MLRYVTPVMNFRRQTTADVVIGDQKIAEDEKVVFFHISANRDEDGLRRRRPVRHRPHPEPPHGLRRRRSPLLPGGQPGPHGDPGDVRAPPRPHTRHPPGRRGPAAPVGLHQRGEAPPGGLQPRPSALTGRLSDCARERLPRALPSGSHLPPHQRGARAGRGRSDQMGYSGMYVSDHLFNPRQLSSRYTYSTAPDGAPFWEKETAWPDPMCLISAMAAVTTNLDLHHRRLRRAGPRPHHRGQAGRHRRGALPQPGPARRRRGMVRRGVRPDRTGLPQPWQAAERHDPGPPRALEGRLGRVPRAPLRRARRAR